MTTFFGFLVEDGLALALALLLVASQMFFAYNSDTKGELLESYLPISAFENTTAHKTGHPFYVVDFLSLLIFQNSFNYFQIRMQFRECQRPPIQRATHIC